jgi:O-succinylbenzoic acid--CoA ligase
MVPMQVWNLVQQAPERLRQIRHLIIGGGAISDELADALKDMPNYIWSTYGMTETLSHIALRRLNGVERSEWYTPFDGVEVSLNEEECLVIHAPAVHEGILVTNDIAELKDGKFRIKGRKDNVVCSGGIKIQIEEVERMLSAHLKVPFLITKKADKKFGEQVVLLTESIDVSNVKEVCQQVLPRYWQPRMYLHVAKIPLTETGKPARAEAEKMVRTYSAHQQ